MGNIGNNDGWCYVTSASSLIQSIEDGFIAPFGLSTSSGYQKDSNDRAGFRIPLVRGSQIGIQASYFIAPLSEIGFPVSVVFNDEISKDEHREIEQSEIRYVQQIFPLIKDSFTIGFQDAGCMEKFKKWMDDSERRPYSFVKDQCFIESSIQTKSDLDLLTPDIESNGELVPEEVLTSFDREQRLQCAIEMTLIVAEKKSQWEFAAALMSGSAAAIPNRANLHGSFSGFLNGEGNDADFVHVLSELLLELPSPRTRSPISCVEKSEIIEKTWKRLGPLHSDAKFFENLLHHVREDVGLSQMESSATSPELQGLLVFLSNNASLTDVIKLTPDSFPDLDPLAVSVCAFFAGLRWRRSRIPSTAHISVLRSANIRELAKFPLRIEADYVRRNLGVEILETGLIIEGEFWSPLADMCVWRFESNVKLVVKTGRTTQMLTDVGFIVVGKRTDIKSAKFVKIFRPHPGNESTILNSINFTKKKSGVGLALFSNRSIGKHLEERSGLELKCVANVYFDSKGDIQRLVKPVVTIVDCEPDFFREVYKITLITKIRNKFSSEKILLPAE